MSRIFISYRREDSSGYAGRLSERLRTHFGDDEVFMDIDAIEPGLDYQDTIETSIGTVDVMVALIGRHWLATLPSGNRRLDNPDDFVRLEIGLALERQVRVIPVLVEGAVMPTAQDLPSSLATLARRNAIEISDSRWDYDCQRLVNVLERALGRPQSPRTVATPQVASSEAPPPPAKPTPATQATQAGRHPTALTAVAAAAGVGVLIWGVLVPRTWHSELAGVRILSEAVLVVLVAAGLWSRQWKWVLAGGIVGTVGVLVWIQLLLSGGHTADDLFNTGDGSANFLSLIASVAVLVVGLVGMRADRRSAPNSG